MRAETIPLFDYHRPKRTRSAWTISKELDRARSHRCRLWDRYDRIVPRVPIKTKEQDPLYWAPPDDSEERKRAVMGDIHPNGRRIERLEAELAAALEYEAWLRTRSNLGG